MGLVVVIVLGTGRRGSLPLIYVINECRKSRVDGQSCEQLGKVGLEAGFDLSFVLHQKALHVDLHWFVRRLAHHGLNSERITMY